MCDEGVVAVLIRRWWGGVGAEEMDVWCRARFEKEVGRRGRSDIVGGSGDGGIFVEEEAGGRIWG